MYQLTTSTRKSRNVNSSLRPWNLQAPVGWASLKLLPVVRIRVANFVRIEVARSL
ncbi:MAG: hypothetical protein ACI9QL_002293, partial [Candidatus Omnitrophota bacterium]